MMELSTILWWWLPTALIAGVLAKRLPNAGLRWPIALAAWIGATGAIGTVALTLHVPIKGIRLAVAALLIACGVWLFNQRRMGSEKEPFSGRYSAKSGFFTPQVLSLLSIALLLVLIATLLWTALSSGGGSAEFFAYSASARSAVLEGGNSTNILNGNLHSLLSEGVVAFPAAVQYATAVLSGTWAQWPAKLPHALIWIAALSFTLSRLREARLPLAGAVLLVMLVLLLPSFITLVGRGSDFAWISACALACSAAWLTPRRGNFALAFAALAFGWNPWLGWPLALSCAVFSLALEAPERWRKRIVYSYIGIAFVATMLVLQSETFLPNTMANWFRSPMQSPVWSGQSLWQGAAVVACAAAAFCALFTLARKHSTLALAWYFATALLLVIATLRAIPSALGATDSALDLALVLFAPALIVVALGAASQTIYTLSDYRLGVSAPISATAVAEEKAPDVALTLLLDLEQMRAQLLRAYEAFGRSEFAPASALAEEVLQSDSNHPDAHHLLALIALQEDRPGDALRSVQRAIDVFPEHALFFLTVADIYGSQQRWAEQAEALATASKLEPADVSIKTKLLLAKRKALMAQAQKAQADQSGTSQAGGQYEIQVRGTSKP